MKKILFILTISLLLFSINAQAQFKLELIKIKCIVSEESSDDETYISVGNKYKIWHYNQGHSGDTGSGDLENQDVRTLTHLAPFKFNCPIVIKIMEGDGGGSADDLLGKLTISVGKNYYTKLGKIQSKEFKNQNWFYRIHYRVSLDD